MDFLLQVVQTAVDAEASYINIPDTVGFTTPAEYGAIFKYLIDHVKTDREIIYSPHCHDDLGMAVANSLAAVKMVPVVLKEPLMESVNGPAMRRLKR